ncbi:alpha/beta fold hydrolase [Deinococcus yavapaiensis]|uniref:Pimeloyl-ACP methyl ester carboxylesterase n=1 Tax=Deinococcus yavapaiensis KR-236 TaxID=694435 RepID=A0A318S858_9DEIO|nr:alpha/beta hydrolase [Deinococcus yavapaiensis]PYE51802.1 pimeloyl-ACP methyl ester carboxylesterase [Deinococcus yavapaiensis KR-236]
MLPHLSGGAGRPLVALHGNFASKAWWHALVTAAPSGWRVLAPDLPGFGDAPPLGEPSIRGFADAVLDFVNASNLDRPVLIGHSLGGAVALELAARHPERFSGLVLAASAPLSGLKTPEENYPVLELLRSDVTLLTASLAALFPSARPHNFDALVQDARRMDPSGFTGNARALERWSVEGRLVTLPTLVLGGELDRLITPEMLALQARALGTTELVLKGRGHGFPQEDPDAFKAALEPFLRSVTRQDLVVES